MEITQIIKKKVNKHLILESKQECEMSLFNSKLKTKTESFCIFGIISLFLFPFHAVSNSVY